MEQCEIQKYYPWEKSHSLMGSHTDDGENFRDPHKSQHHECKKLVSPIKFDEKKDCTNVYRYKDQILNDMSGNQPANRNSISDMLLKLESEVEHSILSLTQGE